MCGIAGFIDFNKMSTKETLIDMTDVLKHRGPDGKGYELFHDTIAHIGMGHTRLSILDLSHNGRQPMHEGDNSIYITLNGEIYNFQEIKIELKKIGYSFSSNTDTEVVLKSYMEWGVDCIQKFRGMFAFVIYDIPKRKIIFVRDRAGVKPLYYYWNKDLFLFASELKSFHKHENFEKSLNFGALSQFLEFGCITLSNTIFNKTFKVKPGHYLEFELDFKTFKEVKYWDAFDAYKNEKLNLSYDEIVVEVKNELKKSFEYRLVSDVPVGIFLSGGYDSTAVASLLQSERTDKLKTFTIGTYDKNLNEANYAKKTANIIGTDHTEFYVETNDALEIIETLPFFYDEPFFDYSSIPTILVSRLARKEVTVALSGDGGDEIFAGYERQLEMLSGSKVGNLKYMAANFLSQLGNNFKNKHFLSESLIDLLRKSDNISKKGSDKNLADSIVRGTLPNIFNSFEQKLLLKKVPKKAISIYDSINTVEVSGKLDLILGTDYKTYMVDDILVKVDRASMSTSLEAREPFLDHHIIELMAKVPSEYKIRNGVQKSILKDIVHQFVPKKYMERPKTGFAIPMADWLIGDLRYLIDYYLNETRIENQGIFDNFYIQILIKQFRDGNEKLYGKLWTLITFQMWYEKWMQ